MKICIKIILNLTVIFLFLIGSFSCQNSDDNDTTKNITGTVIGNYSNGFFSLLVQVDEKYPIGKIIEYVETPGNCTQLPGTGTYRNMIQVQPDLPVSDMPETIINRKISFSYRLYQSEKDGDLFSVGSAGNALCDNPDVPIYVITDCQILN